MCRIDTGMSQESGGTTTVESDGFSVSSNTDSAKDMRAAFAGAADAPASQPKAAADLKGDVTQTDDSGTLRGADGKFKGPVKPIPPVKAEVKDAKAPEKTPQKAAQAPADAPGDADKSEDDPEAAKPDEKGKDDEARERRKRDAAWRVQQATARAAEERRAREAKEAEVAQLRAELDAVKSGRAAPPPADRRAAPADAGEPDPEQFETLKDYLGARDKWNRDQWRNEQRQEAEVAARRQEAAHVQQRITEAVATFQAAVGEEGALEGVDEAIMEKLVPSFVARANGERPGPLNYVADEVVAAGKRAPALLRYLTENRDELQRLSTLHPLAIARQMGRIQAKLEAATTAVPAQSPAYKPEAFRPVRAVTGRPHAVDADEDDSALEFEALVSKRLRQGKHLARR